jgi:O-antigen/teichoic acid export membrane protein
MTGVLSQAFWITASRFGSQVLLAMYTIVLARRLGSAGFGGYAFVAAVILLGNTLTTFGTDMHLIRRIAATRDLSALPPALFIQLGLSAVFIAAVLTLSPYLPNQSPDTIRGLQLYSLALIPLAIHTIFTTALRGLSEMGAYAMIVFAGALAQAGLVWFFFPSGGSVYQAASLLLFSHTLTAALAAGLGVLRLPLSWRGWRYSGAEIRTLALASAPVALLAFLGILYQRLSLLLMPTLGGALVTGWFGAAARSVEAAKTIHISAFTALYPQMARLAAEDSSLASAAPLVASTRAGEESASRIDQSIIETSEKSRKVLGMVPKPLLALLAVGAAIALSLSVFAGPLVILLFGADYTPAVPALRILAWMLIPYTITAYLSLAMLAAGRERIVVRGLVVGLLVLALLLFLLVPLAGPNGAALACLIAELAHAGVLLAYHIPVRLRSNLVEEQHP